MAKKGGPVAGNRLKKDLAQLFRFAAKQYGFAGQNPAVLADTNRVRSRGFHTWSDDEIASFRAKHATGSKARLALELLLGTGAAGCRWAHPPEHPGRPPLLSTGQDGAGSRPAHPARTGGGTGAPAAGSDDAARARDPGRGVHAGVFTAIGSGSVASRRVYRIAPLMGCGRPAHGALLSMVRPNSKSRRSSRTRARGRPAGTSRPPIGRSRPTQVWRNWGGS